MSKLNTTTKILIILGVFNLSFIAAMIIIFCVKDAVPDTLITCVLGASGVEGFLCAAIKISNIIKGKTETDKQIETEESNNDLGSYY